MSDIMRTALKDGGQIKISIDRWPDGDFHLCVTEFWARLESFERAVVSAEEIDAAEDQDGLLRDTLVRLVGKVHMNWEAHKMVKGGEHGNL